MAERCSSLREHLVALRLDGVTDAREQHARAQRAALGERFLAECAGYGEARLTCAISAGDSKEVTACLRGEP